MPFQELQRKITQKELTPWPLFLYISNILSISTFMQNMKRFLTLFCKIEAETKMPFQELQREITQKELILWPLVLHISNILSISTFMQNMKRFLLLFSKIRSRNQNVPDRLTDRCENSIFPPPPPPPPPLQQTVPFQKLQREIIQKELTLWPLFLCNSNILSISFMQSMKRFLKLFSKIRSRNPNIKDGQRENSITNTVCCCVGGGVV